MLLRAVSSDTAGREVCLKSLVWWPRSDQCRRITGNDSPPLGASRSLSLPFLPLTPSDSSGPRCAHTLLHQLKSKCHHRHRDEHAQSALIPRQTCEDYESPPRRETVVTCSDEAVTKPGRSCRMHPKSLGVIHLHPPPCGSSPRTHRIWTLA